MPEQLTPAVQDYLKAIHSLGGAERQVSPNDIAARLEVPLEDPHGHPIPTREGALAQRALKSLDKFRAGERVVIREAEDTQPERLRRWRELGLTPGATVRVRSYQPLDDLFELEVGDQ